jgi:hypothetical protein
MKSALTLAAAARLTVSLLGVAACGAMVDMHRLFGSPADRHRLAPGGRRPGFASMLTSQPPEPGEYYSPVLGG